MKTLMLACLTAASFAALLPASAKVQPAISATAPNAAGQPGTVRLGLITRTTALIGTTVRDRGDRSLGRMEDIYLDLPTGQAVAALVSFGTDDHLMLVPARSFWTATRNMIMFMDDKKTLKRAPCFARADMAWGLEPDRLSRSFDYFMQELPEATTANPGRLFSAARLVRRQLVSENGGLLGQIADVALDLPVGQAVYLLVEPAADAGASGVLYAVPLKAFSRGPDGRPLVLNTDRAHFLAGPHFQKEFGSELCRPEFGAAVQRHYNH